MGSAALTLCHVAMGAVEGYHSDNLMPWDVAAGVLIIKEAGGVVIDTNGIILFVPSIISLILIKVIYTVILKMYSQQILYNIWRKKGLRCLLASLLLNITDINY